MLGVFNKMVCLAYFIKWRACRASINGVLDVLGVLKIDEMFF